MTTAAFMTDNTDRQRFELTEGGHLAFASYVRHPTHYALPYVEAAPALRGTGAANRLMEGVVAHARAENMKLLPVCGYAVAWFNRHPQHAGLLVDKA